MPISAQRKVRFGFALALLLLLGIGGAAYRGVRQMHDAAIAERHSSAVIAALSGVVESMTQAESGQRGYLLFGDSSSLRTYRNAVSGLPRVAADLHGAALDDESPRVAHILGLMNRRQHELAETIAAWNANERSSAMDIARTARGRGVMDSIRADIGSLRDAELGRLGDRRSIAATELDRVGLVITLGVLVTLAIAAFAVAMSARDERSRARAAASLERARDEAESASRAKSDFLARMSHELRTPLNSIIGFSKVLQRNKRGVLEATELSYLARIESNGIQLLTIINDILDLAKVESGRMEVLIAPVDLPSLVRETADSFAGMMVGGDVELVLDVPASLEPLRTDTDKLRQVVTNLLGNAIKFTEKGTVLVRLLADGTGTRAWRLDVIDEGTGVPPSRQAAIFGAFEQGENTISRRFGGTGLGLSISKSICERLGFGLTVVSNDGMGSTFSILFDSAARPPVRHERPSGSIRNAEEFAYGAGASEPDAVDSDAHGAMPWNARMTGR
ncbi:MAG: ATP-binding protein [bacterium]